MTTRNFTVVRKAPPIPINHNGLTTNHNNNHVSVPVPAHSGSPVSSSPVRSVSETNINKLAQNAGKTFFFSFSMV